jgi:transposase
MIIEEGKMNYVGVDYHKKYSYIVIKNKDGRILGKSTVNNTREEIQQFVKPYCPGMAVVEATRNWGLIYDWLDEVLDDVALAHPLKVKAIAEAKIKTDKISANVLADLLRADLLPRAYAPSKHTRELKSFLRQRMFLVRIQTMVKNRVHDILDRHPDVLREAPEVSDLFGAAGMKWLGQATLAGKDNGLLICEIELLGFLKEKISQSNETVRELAKKDPRTKLLQSIPGIGSFFATLILYEIDDVSRFRDEKKLCSYAGLVPSTYASGGKVFHGRITKTGSKWLRWAVIEAAQTAVRSNSEFHAYYQRIRVRKGTNAAKVATARRLLTIVYRLLRQGRCYEKRSNEPGNTSAPAALVTP